MSPPGWDNWPGKAGVVECWNPPEGEGVQRSDQQQSVHEHGELGCPFLSRCLFFSFLNVILVWSLFKQNKDGSYTGFIKVQFKLARPVSVPAPKKGSQDACGRRASGVKRRTSFYLPKDASKYLHISSRTSAREVIEALLKKFTVVDNPGKFALFERSERHDQGETLGSSFLFTQYSKCCEVINLFVCLLVYIRKLSDEERPLRLRLCSGPSEKVLSFVLKENETGEVNVSETGTRWCTIHVFTLLTPMFLIFLYFQWHAFSMPELKNFLLILQREEEEHVKQIIQRYALARTKMRDALAGSTPGWFHQKLGGQRARLGRTNQPTLHVTIPEKQNGKTRLFDERECDQARDREKR